MSQKANIHLYVESKIQNRNRHMDIDSRLVVLGGGVRGAGMQWEVGVRICKLLYMEVINNKVLLYSTENHILYPMINHNGKE